MIEIIATGRRGRFARSRSLPSLMSLSLAFGCAQLQGTASVSTSELAQPLLTGNAALYEENIEQYSALASNGADWGPAFQAFLTTSAASRLRLSCDKVYPVGASSDGLGACSSDGTEIPAAVNICREVTIVGCGGSTVIETEPGVTASAVRFISWCGGTGSAHGGGTLLKDLTIREAGSGATRRFGVLMQSQATVEDVQIKGFSNGVRIDGSVSSTSCLGHTGANLWAMHRLQLSGAEHAGVVVRNQDANVGDARSIRSSGNCQAPDKLDGAGQPLYEGVRWPICAGVIDDSPIGSTWTSIYAHDNNGFPGERFDSTAPAVCVGCYSSGAVADNEAQLASGGRTLTLGGSATPSFAGVNFSRAVISNLQLFAATMLPLDEDGDSDPLLFLQVQSGQRLQIEQDPTNVLGLRGSLDGRDDKVAWRWIGNPPEWIYYP